MEGSVPLVRPLSRPLMGLKQVPPAFLQPSPGPTPFTGWTTSRQSSPAPWVLANLGSCWLSSLQSTTEGHCKGQEDHRRRRSERGSGGPELPWGRDRGAEGSSLRGGKISPSQKANTSPETSRREGGVVETYLYNAEAALFSPFGLLGLGSPAMLISAMNGHAAVTRHGTVTLTGSRTRPRSKAGCGQPAISRNKLLHTSHRISTCF